MSGKNFHVKHHGRTLKKDFGNPIHKGSVIGIHIDMDKGCMHVFQDGQHLGEAFGLSSGLKGRTLYPAFHQAMGFRCTVRHLPSDTYPKVPKEPPAAP